MLEEEDVTSETLMKTIDDVMTHRSKYIENMKNSGQMNAIETIMGLIKDVSRS